MFLTNALLKMCICCRLLLFALLFYGNVPKTFAQTALPTESDSFSTTITTCETGSSCGTDANDLTTVSPFSSTINSVTASTAVRVRSTAAPTRKSDIANNSSLPSTVKPPTIHKQAKEHTILSDGICACDLMAFACDINCCCDPDCSAFDRQSFSKCNIKEGPPYENRYCYATKLIFLNNTEHIIQQTENGMFCIVRSNLAGSVIYPHRPTVSSKQDFIRRWKLSHSSTWPIMLSSKSFNLNTAESYIEGSSLWILWNQKIHYYGLPASGLTSVCSDTKAIQFLRPWSSQCIQKPPQTQAQCDSLGLNSYQQVFSVVKSPLLVNLTELISRNSNVCPLNVCVQVNAFVCHEKHPFSNISLTCKEVSNRALLNMSFVKAGMCHGIVKNLRYNFIHNGTEGIKHISAYFVLSNVSMTGSSSPLLHTSSVEFSWAQENVVKRNSSENETHLPNSNAPLPRSGNPGYIVGKPIPAGFRVKHRTDLNNSKGTTPNTSENPKKNGDVQLSANPRQWLTLPGSNPNGFCDSDGSQRTVVTFGEDVHLSCGVMITPSNLSSEIECKKLREAMMHMLLGGEASASNISQLSEWTRVVAAFGNANTSNHQEWVPLLLDSPISLMHPSPASSDSSGKLLTPSSSCEDVPLGIHLQIMYGLVGSVSNPQAKIVGALFRVDPVRDVSWSCVPPVCIQKMDAKHLHVVSSVVFVDVSSPSVTRFAEPPAIHIRLPPDFFYPFLSSGAAVSKSFLTIQFIIFLLTILLASNVH